MDKIRFAKGDTVLFIGDSITDCGRDAPYRPGGHPLGDGYVRLFSDLMRAARPEIPVACTNRGIGGNTVKDLSRRWREDVIASRPDWLSLMVGINDIHRWLRGEKTGVCPETFRKEYAALLDIAAKEVGCNMIVLDPFYISRGGTGDPFGNRVLEFLPEYIAAAAAAAEKHGAARVRTHDAFRKRLEYAPGETFCPEPVHPNSTGHTVIAWELFSLVGG